MKSDILFRQSCIAFLIIGLFTVFGRPLSCLAEMPAPHLADLQQTVTELASYGDRSTGSSGEKRAAEYILHRFSLATSGQTGKLPFTLPVRKHGGSTLMVGEQRMELHPLYYNAITPQNLPAEGIQGPLLYVGKGELRDFNGLDIRGSIVLMDFDSGTNWLNAANLGAQALIYLDSGQSFKELFTEKQELTPIQFPCFWIPKKRLSQLYPDLAPGKIAEQIRLQSAVQWQQHESDNIYAFFQGSDAQKKEQLIVVEAFFDASQNVADTAPGADEALSIASLLQLADYLHNHPPQHSFLLLATSGHDQELAGMREMVWSLTSTGKMFRTISKQQRQELKTRTAYLKTLSAFLQHKAVAENSTSFGDSIRESLKLKIDELSNRLMSMRMQEQSSLITAKVQQLADTRIKLRRISWKKDFSSLNPEELEVLVSLAQKAQELHTGVIRELKADRKRLEQQREFRSLVLEYEPRLFVSLHLSSHGDGLAAFNQGFMYPLRERINRTGSYREFHQILHQAVSQEKTPFPFISTLRPDRLHPWEDLLPDKPHLGGEVTALAGLPGITLATTGDSRCWWGTPFDQIHNIQWQKVTQQHQVLEHLITALDRSDLSVSNSLRNGFATVTGKTSLLLHGELFAEQPAPGSILLIYQGPARYHLQANSQGQFLLKGVADKKHVQDKVIFEGYIFSTKDGAVLGAIDKKLTGKAAYRLKMQRQDMRTDLIMFNCSQTTIFNLLEPRSLRYLTKLQLIDGAREAPPVRYWYSRIDTRSSTIASLFLEPETRMKLTLSDTLLDKKLILTNGSSETPMGNGYKVSAHPSLHHTSYLVARDMWALLAPRIRNLEQHGIFDEYINALQEQGLAALKKSHQALQDKRYDRMFANATASWALADRVYTHVEQTQKDVLFGVLFYIALFVPFAFCMERLLFAYTSIYKRIIAFTGILVLLIALIANVHPAFKLAYSPTVVIIAFFIIGLSFLVTLIIFFRFEQQMIMLQRRASMTKATELSSWKAFTAAFYLGVSNLNRRKMRTGLTCLTLIILTFTIMSFTSVSSTRRQNELHFAEQGSYTGYLLKDMAWNDLPRQTLTMFSSLFDSQVTVGPRIWYSNEDLTRSADIQLRMTNNQFTIQGLIGLSSQEPQISRLHETLVAGRWFNPDERNVILLPEKLAHRANIHPGIAGKDSIVLWGVSFQVVGLFSEDGFRQHPDLDEEIITPVVFPSQSVRELSDEEQEAMESGEDIQTYQGRYRHIDPDQIAIIPADTLLAMGGMLKSIALIIPEQAKDNSLSFLSDRFNFTLFRSDQNGVSVFHASDAMSYSGMPNIIIPLLISILIVLNTMISSVFERKKEIGIYTSVGLAPRHVSFLFIAEAMAFAIISVVLGYLLAQTLAGFLADTPLWQGITVNYSSTAGVAAMFLVMAVVLLSVIYPSKVAASIAIPDVNRSWVMPAPENDAITLTLPFLMRYHEHHSICGFLYEYFSTHQDVSHGLFSTGPIEIVETCQLTALGLQRLPMAEDCLHIRAKVWLAPFDFGIMQWVDLSFCHAREGKDFLEISVVLNRRSGEAGVWKRVNTSFVHSLRKQLLIWRSLHDNDKKHYAQLLLHTAGQEGQQ
ncbi:FtsX-like permease family protein [Desulfogranum japonicum]|uniref:FtsX-like permease family protein n=1 Tax=Desulfogranum japonicum TaxID=231447 RepID=UPI000416E4E2|nr:FtsX-like permease family protein [Desulfogranum japonicum]